MREILVVIGCSIQVKRVYLFIRVLFDRIVRLQNVNLTDFEEKEKSR